MVARIIGNRGEDIAVAHLVRWGYRIIERNFTIRGGEIDIICEKDGMYYFVEVKYRTNTHFGHPLETITSAKLEKLEYTMMTYCHEKSIDSDRICLYLFGIVEKGHVRKIFFESV